MRADNWDEYEEYYDDYDEYADYDESQPHFLSAREMIFFCLAFMTPVSTIFVYGKAQAAAHGAFAGSYIVALILVFLTFLSYRRLGHAFSEDGSVFAYAGFGIHLKAGYFTGAAALMFYIMIACAFFMMGASAAAEMFAPIPYVFWLILIAAVSGGLALYGRRISSLAITVIVLGVIGITAIYILVCFIAAGRGAAPEGTSAATALSGTDANFGTLMSGAAIACLSFLGFESATTLSYETDKPRRNCNKAMLVSCLAAAALFFFQVLASALIAPDFSALNPATAMFDIAETAGGSPMGSLLSFSVVIASFGVGIVAITAASRMLRTLIEGTRAFEDPQDEIAPRPPGFISDMLSQAGAPGILVVACTVAAVALAFIVPGKDAYLALDLARFAGMLCFMLINFAALVFFWFRRHDQVYVRSLVIPAAGFLTSLWVWINIEPASFNYGIIFALAGVIVIAASHIFSRLVFGTEPDILEDEDAI